MRQVKVEVVLLPLRQWAFERHAQIEVERADHRRRDQEATDRLDGECCAGALQSDHAESTCYLVSVAGTALVK